MSTADSPERSQSVWPQPSPESLAAWHHAGCLLREASQRCDGEISSRADRLANLMYTLNPDPSTALLVDLDPISADATPLGLIRRAELLTHSHGIETFPPGASSVIADLVRLAAAASRAQEPALPRETLTSPTPGALDTLMDVGTILSQAFSRAWQASATGTYDTADRIEEVGLAFAVLIPADLWQTYCDRKLDAELADHSPAELVREALARVSHVNLENYPTGTSTAIYALVRLTSHVAQ